MIALLQRRELLESLVIRNLKARYKQAFLGVAWAVLQPLSLMLIFTLVLSPFIPPPESGIPYAVFVFSGLLPWNFLAAALNFGSTSLVSNASLLKKIYFPREMLTLAAVLAGLVDLGLGLVVLIGMMFWFDMTPGPGLLALPGAVLLLGFLAAGVALILAAANVFFRDIRHAVPLATLLWMFATPVTYPLERAPEPLRELLCWNPATFPVETFRASLLGQPLPEPAAWVQAAALSLTVLFLGFAFFRRAEPFFAEII